MTIAPDVAVVVAVMAAAALLCRFGGYWFMGFLSITPRMKAGLDAIPLAVMLGIMVPPVLRGGIPEAAGIAATIAAVRLGANDLVAILAGLAIVAGLRLVT